MIPNGVGQTPRCRATLVGLSRLGFADVHAVQPDFRLRSDDTEFSSHGDV